MSEDMTKEIIRTIVADALGVPAQDIPYNTPLDICDIAVDSLDVVLITTNLERDFGIRLTNEDICFDMTVNQIANLIRNRKRGKQ